MLHRLERPRNQELKKFLKKARFRGGEFPSDEKRDEKKMRAVDWARFFAEFSNKNKKVAWVCSREYLVSLHFSS